MRAAALALALGACVEADPPCVRWGPRLPCQTVLMPTLIGENIFLLPQIHCPEARCLERAPARAHAGPCPARCR